jgi:uncharacterized membrane protein YqjE
MSRSKERAYRKGRKENLRHTLFLASFAVLFANFEVMIFLTLQIIHPIAAYNLY